MIESVSYMNDPESSEKQYDDYEKELLETNQEILFQIRGFSRQAIEVSWITLALIVLYLFISLILFIFLKIKIKTGIVDLGTITPLLILISTIINEVRVRIMEWAAVKRERREYEKAQRETKLRTEGKNEVITALTHLAETSKGEMTVEKAIETYKAQNGNTDNGNTTS